MINKAKRLASLGFRVFPIRPGPHKRPFFDAWQHTATFDEKKIESWWRQWPTANVGIACGRVSNLVVVDVDDMSSENSADVMDRLPSTFTVSTPRGGLHFYLRFPTHGDDDDVIRNVQGGKESGGQKAGCLGYGVDVRGEGGYVLAVGSSIDGVAYEVANDTEIAEVPEWVLERLRKAKRLPQALPMPAWTPDLGGAAGKLDCVERARRYVARMPGAISGAGGHNATIKVARVLVTGFGLDDGAALSVLQEFNSKCSPPWSPKELQHKVSSARKTNDPRGNVAGHLMVDGTFGGSGDVDAFHGAEITVGTAEETDGDATGTGGYTVGTPAGLLGESTRPQPIDITANLIARDSDAAQWDLLRQVRQLGGLCDSFAGWVIGGAEYPQPALTVGAVLALGSAMSARRWVYGRTTGSLYLCAIAPTASGKGRPQACVSTALRAVWANAIGASDLSSTASSIAKLQETTLGGTGLCLVLDEYGPRLKTLLDTTGGHQREMRALLLQLGTIGTGDYVAAQSLSRGGGEVTLTAPALTVYGSSTPAALHDAVGRMALEDGLLGRHLFFESLSVLPQRCNPPTAPLPEDVRLAIDCCRRAHEAWHQSMPPVGSSADGTPILMYRPDEVEDGGGQAVLDAFALRCDERRRDPMDGDVAPELLGRAAEHAARVCVCLAVLQAAHPAFPLVTRETAECAVAVVEASLAAISKSLRENAAEHGTHHRIVLRVKRLLRGAKAADGWVTWSELLRRCEGVKTAELEEVVDRLAEQKSIEMQKAVGPKGGRPLRRLRWLADRAG